MRHPPNNMYLNRKIIMTDPFPDFPQCRWLPKTSNKTILEFLVLICRLEASVLHGTRVYMRRDQLLTGTQTLKIA